MTSAESILAQAAEDGSIDSEAWPETLQYILDRLDEIITDFPKPTTPPADPLASSSDINTTPPRPSALFSSQDSHAGDKENAPPQTPTRPPVPAFTGTPPSSDPESRNLPSETLTFYSAIRNTLSKNFPTNPPHTIQRLAELVLHPKQRYRFLPPYLRALDRVVSVSSPTTVFPLPQSVLPNPGGFLNGTTDTPPSTLGSDESLGGALLTPIPWLNHELISESTEMVDGPNGAGRCETVSVVNGQLTSTSSQAQNQGQISSGHPDGESLPSTGPVTQGELLRQEQEAGVTLSNPHSMQTNRNLLRDTEGGGVVRQTVEEDEAPHARGPQLIDMIDTGPQRSPGPLDMEGAVGRPGLERLSKSPGPAAKEETASENKDQEMKDGVGGADGETKEDVKKEEVTKEGTDTEGVQKTEAEKDKKEEDEEMIMTA